jgi:two-component system, sensor histidine kinase and response regulator
MKRILIIDDEESLRDMVHMALAQRGFDVIEAENGALGIEKARKQLPDLVLCDVNMEKEDSGYLTLSLLRNEPATAAIPFILMTGRADNAGLRHGMELGADDYLSKPFSIEQLFAAVEARLKKAQAQRQEAEKKLADLRDNISLMLPHELRTPLNGILAYGEILSTDAASLPPNEIAEMGQIIHESGRRLERLIENSLIYSQIELMGQDAKHTAALRKKRTRSPGELIKTRALHQAAEHGRTADLALELTDQPVAISEQYLTKIVDELVQNAFKFSKPATRVRVALLRSDQGLILSVADHGRGLAPEQVAMVGAYVQFERKLHEQQGLGLGLIIAKRLTELHGGTLTIQSEPGLGTTIDVRLPAAAAE